MIQVMPNTGILSDDSFDRLRADAIFAAKDGLPEAVVYYLRALENQFLNFQIERKRQALHEISWKFEKAQPDVD